MGFSLFAARFSMEVIQNNTVNASKFKKRRDEKYVVSFSKFIFRLESITLCCKVPNTLAAAASLGLQDEPRG